MRERDADARFGSVLVTPPPCEDVDDDGACMRAIGAGVRGASSRTPIFP